MKVLIVGGTGYIGSRLAFHLKKSSNKFDLGITTTQTRADLWTKDFSVFQMDLTDERSVSETMIRFEPHVVVDLASLPQIRCEEDAKLAENINVNGTKRLLNQCSKIGVKRFIYLSTFQIYGKNLEGIINENNYPNPHNVYSRTKYESEKLIRLEEGMEKVILRMSNAFGAPVSVNMSKEVWGLVFNSFSVACFSSKRIKPKGNPLRDFITISDAVRAIEHVIMLPSKEVQGSKVFNLGGENTMCINDVAHKIAKVFEQRFGVPIVVEDSSELPGKMFTYDISKLKDTGFSLAGNMDEEIYKTLLIAEQYVWEKDKNA